MMVLNHFKGSIIFTSYDFEFINTMQTRVIDLNNQGGVSKEIPYGRILARNRRFKINIICRISFRKSL